LGAPPSAQIVQAISRQNIVTFGGVYFGESVLGGQEHALTAAKATASAPAPTLLISSSGAVPTATATAAFPRPVPRVRLAVPVAGAIASAPVPSLGIGEAGTRQSNLPTKLRFSYRRRLVLSHHTTLMLDPGATNLVHDARELELVLDG
jgi:hypothetical protein